MPGLRIGGLLPRMAKVMDRHAKIGGGYPMCLKAAHEEARLSMGDEQRIDQVMERALMEKGILALPSSKQEAKERR